VHNLRIVKSAAGGDDHVGDPRCRNRPDPIVFREASARLLLFSRRRAPDDPNGDEIRELDSGPSAA
jgi:hypothetical protein